METLTFGSEFITRMMAVMEHIEGIRYKLRMFDIPLDGLTTMLWNNNLVVMSSTIPELRLKKKHNSTTFHKVREVVATSIASITHVKSNEKIADPLMIALTATKRFLLL